MNGTDPTTTLPAAGGNSLAMMLILAGLAALLSPIAIRMFIRSLRPQASEARKITASILCAVLAIDLAIMVPVAGAGFFVTTLLVLAGLGFTGYAIPAVRASAFDWVGGLFHRLHHKVESKDHASHI